MNNLRTRNFIAIMVVSAYVVTIAILTLAPPVFKIGDPAVWQEFMKSFGSLTTGMVGVIMGFYFGQSTTAREEKSKEDN